jgi:heme-degrading monooxygenase HmoA
MYVIAWEFIIREECLAEFAAAYGPRGDWARLFATGDGYCETQLLRDTTNPRRYVTLDFWKSCETHDRFRREHAREYKALDQRCERLTLKENKLGEFETA